MKFFLKILALIVLHIFFGQCFLSVSRTSWSLSSLPHKNGILLYGLGHTVILKLRIMTMGLSAPLGRIAHILKLMNKFKIAYSLKLMCSFKVLVYRSNEA